MALLIVEKGSSEDIGKVFSLPTDPITIGRRTGNNDPAICFNDVRVSRKHAELVFKQGRYYIRDLGSRNGTQVDGQVLYPDRLYPLKHNSAIGLVLTSQGPGILLRFSESDETAPITEARRKALTGSTAWLKIDEGKKQVWVDGKEIQLSRKEYLLLELLHRNAGKICSRDEIIPAVWPEVQDPGSISDASIDQLIHRLREKIEPDPGRPSRILSKKGFGYMLNI